MRTHASIRSRPVRITGGPHSGWRVASANEKSARLISFDFDITDDGAGEFLLAYRSADGVYNGDSACETLEDALITGERQFGISRSEWGKSLSS